MRDKYQFVIKSLSYSWFAAGYIAKRYDGRIA